MKVDRTPTAATPKALETGSKASSSSKTPAPPASGPVPRDAGRQQAARERFAATTPQPRGGEKAPTKVTRAFVREQAAEGVLTAKEARQALAMGASTDQIRKWSEGEALAGRAEVVLQAADLAPAADADPKGPFSAGGRDYASAEDYVRYQAAEGVLTGDEVKMALKRGATPAQIEDWSRGETIADNGKRMLALVKSAGPIPSPALPTSPPSTTSPSLPLTPTRPPVALRPLPPIAMPPPTPSPATTSPSLPPTQASPLPPTRPPVAPRPLPPIAMPPPTPSPPTARPAVPVRPTPPPTLPPVAAPPVAAPPVAAPPVAAPPPTPVAAPPPTPPSVAAPPLPSLPPSFEPPTRDDWHAETPPTVVPPPARRPPGAPPAPGAGGPPAPDDWHRHEP